MFSSGTWGQKAKERSKKRLEYFKQYSWLKYRGIFRPKATTGRLGESYAHMLMYDGRRENAATHDFVWKRRRIEVKTSEGTDRWLFIIPKIQREGSKHVLLFCLTNGNPVAMYFLPSRVVPQAVRITPRTLKRYQMFKV